jgi:Zn-dependent M28 family amino/carboxypeptidase
MVKAKKIIILSVMLVLLLTSCNRNNYSPEPTNNDPSVNYNDFMPITGTYALTEQGAYTVVERRVYYLNDENKWNLLCFDPACGHTSPECSAYVNGTSSIFTHEGYIYYFSRYINNEFTLSRMNLMGKEREEIKKISIENPTSRANYAYQISASNILIRFRSIDTSKDYVLTTLYTGLATLF